MKDDDYLIVNLWQAIGIQSMAFWLEEEKTTLFPSCE
jgi:hypothetical protein